MSRPADHGGTDHGVGYHERLTVPWWTVLVALFWAATLGVAFGHALGPWVGAIVAALALCLAFGGLLQASTLVVVDEAGLRVGSAHLPHRCIGGTRSLDAEAAARVRGPEADPRAFTAIRGWVPTAVVVQVADPRDPTPYWYMSTRHPERLAAALRRARASPAA